jgi:hypothetical protein
MISALLSSAMGDFALRVTLRPRPARFAGSTGRCALGLSERVGVDEPGAGMACRVVILASSPARVRARTGAGVVASRAGRVELRWRTAVAAGLGYPAARVVTGEREHLHPGSEFGGERDDGAPDLVLDEVVQRPVGQPVSLELRMRSSRRARAAVT